MWTEPKLRDWMERELGKQLSRSPIDRLLHEMGFRLLATCIVHNRANPHRPPFARDGLQPPLSPLSAPEEG
ncbi:helix-turn-helix domain-containing protein [Chloroflexus sp.]|uniref:helix-turn-helix domain-containing protein n=1 Tax=Chloroflexus sp. TaxID=1904827 RepID=UPI003A0FEA96